MIRERRFELIMSELAKRGVVDGDELAALLNVSRATIRRDLDALEAQGSLRRTHGGAQGIESSEELPFHSKIAANMQEKRAIGLLTASLILEGSVVGCTGGTTVMAVVKYLKGKSVTVVTNAINIAMELAPSEKTEVIVTGGSLRKRSYELVGHVADRTLGELHLDVALIGVDGLDLSLGLSTYTMEEAHTASLYIQHAKRAWVVADHTKIGRIAPALISPLSQVHRLVTDPGLDPELRAALEQGGLEVAIAEL